MILPVPILDYRPGPPTLAGAVAVQAPCPVRSRSYKPLQPAGDDIEHGQKGDVREHALALVVPAKQGEQCRVVGGQESHHQRGPGIPAVIHFQPALPVLAGDPVIVSVQAVRVRSDNDNLKRAISVIRPIAGT